MGLFHERFFHRNSNSMENLFKCNSNVGYLIVTKKCTYHVNTTIVPCAKFHSDNFITTLMRAKWNFHRIWITKNHGNYGKIVREMGPRGSSQFNSFLNMKMSSYQYRNFRYKDEAVSRLSYFIMEISISERQSLHWDGGPGPIRDLGAISIRKMFLPGMVIPMLKIRRPNGRLIFNMEIAIRR